MCFLFPLSPPPRPVRNKAREFKKYEYTKKLGIRGRVNRQKLVSPVESLGVSRPKKKFIIHMRETRIW